MLLLTSSLLASCARPTPTATPTASASPAPPTATPEPLAASVNGEGIALAEWDAQVTQYLQAHAALGETVPEETASTYVLEDLIAEVLLAQAARQAGFVLTPDALQSRIQSLEKDLGGPDKLAAWQASHGYTEATFPAALQRATEAAYMRDQIISAVPHTAEQVHVQQILLYNESDATRISNQLRGGVDFDAMAAAIDPRTRGELSWFPRGYLLEPEIEEAAFSMQIGEISEVIHTDVGYHILKVLDRDENHPLSPDAYLALQEQALKAWVTEHRAAATVVLAP
ncbi:MAG TPA: peptidylprolyl isomerase [Anaerolineales bacterium]|nr:peptidylprolyl isomerase [Anaerolineales bacterium]